MDEESKLPLKRVEFSLTKFNEVEIPHLLELLRQHKANIIKYEEQGELVRARAEQTHARRVASQLRGLLHELDSLRRQVREADRARFDAQTQRSRDNTLRAIVDYLGLIEDSCRALVAATARGRRAGTSPLSIKRSLPETPPVAASAVSTDSVGLVAHHDDAPPEFPAQIQLHVEDQAVQLQQREELQRGFSELQSELHALHDAWQCMQAAALAQRHQVSATAASVEVAADNVSAARDHLAAGERLRAGAWGVSGAALGLLAGGPVGLAVGAKAGALAAAAGSLLGYLGARVLGRRARLDAPPPSPPDDKEGKAD
ncbi:hypothetical protein PYW07_010967 [Mythimna separata]|uniref:STX17-like N-terminal domain-containing protein n=1 Tax=Mythimna separata TaxID=271217 RepID=A0AAD7Y8L9_MYTSE|nr:hypothetical protein PYW07_010967 [Mythimna separata]